jgi:phosphoribosylamine---glycine ligase
MNVLILGSGGREHALAWKVAQSTRLQNLYIAPGNAGTAHCGTNVNIQVSDFEGIKKLVWEKAIDMVIVGPEDPLVNGIHDYFLNDDVLRTVPVIGPRRDGARLEGSKDFSKAFMRRYGIPTAQYSTFTSETLDEGKAFLGHLSPPYVLKADGLAAGKGVLIINDLEEARKELEIMLRGAKFGKASEKVVIEEFLSGIELSVFVLTDGITYKLLPSAKDYKRIGEGDTGLNTGGMGAVSPVPFADAGFLKKVEKKIVKPTLEGLQLEGIDYRGFIFIGLMNCDGDPFVIEYNCRMGDPETEAVIPRIKSDLLDLMEGVATQTLDQREYETSDETAVSVVLVSGGYPGDFRKGIDITELGPSSDSLVFHSGTRQDGERVLTNGGRVFAVTSLGRDIDEAAAKSFAMADRITYEGKYYRKDIGRDLVVSQK